MKIFIVGLEDTKLVNRTDILDWFCSPQVGKGIMNDTHWIIQTNVQLYNSFGDPDVGYFMKMLERVLAKGYESLMIMKYGTEYRGKDSQNSGEQRQDRKDEIQHPDNPPVGEVSTGEPRLEVPAGTTESGD